MPKIARAKRNNPFTPSPTQDLRRYFSPLSTGRRHAESQLSSFASSRISSASSPQGSSSYRSSQRSSPSQHESRSYPAPSFGHGIPITIHDPGSDTWSASASSSCTNTACLDTLHFSVLHANATFQKVVDRPLSAGYSHDFRRLQSASPLLSKESSVLISAHSSLSSGNPV